MNLLREKQRCLRAHRLQGGLFGGDSSSDSSQTTNQYDQRATAGQQGLAVSGSNNVVTNNTTDFGSVQAGTELARRAIAAAVLSAEDSAANTRAAFGGALDAVSKAYETSKAGDQRIVSMVGLAVVGIAAIVMVPAVFKRG
jgi:hypothetical protein